jgi:hypothetical protein
MSDFQTRLINASHKLSPVYLVTATADGKPAWYYVQVDEPKHNAFQKQAEQGGAFNVASFGKVLESGWGTFPAEPIQALMQEKYAA